MSFYRYSFDFRKQEKCEKSLSEFTRNEARKSVQINKVTTWSDNINFNLNFQASFFFFFLFFSNISLPQLIFAE